MVNDNDNTKDTSTLVRLLQYTISEARSLGFVEIEWATDLSNGSIIAIRETDNERVIMEIECPCAPASPEIY
ncbi:MAG: hypothetical protein KAI73_04865 [Rhodospirillaceae bacterium]|nr:hypothetical protein [Rhodospirillaceae bacterium]